MEIVPKPEIIISQNYNYGYELYMEIDNMRTYKYFRTKYFRTKCFRTKCFRNKCFPTTKLNASWRQAFFIF